MNLLEIIEKIKTLKVNLANKYGIDRIGVFGSYARGEQSVESDIDILVEFNKPIGIEFIDLADDLEKELAHKIDLVSRGGVKDRLWMLIEKEVVYV